MEHCQYVKCGLRSLWRCRRAANWHFWVLTQMSTSVPRITEDVTTL